MFSVDLNLLIKLVLDFVIFQNKTLHILELMISYAYDAIVKKMHVFCFEKNFMLKNDNFSAFTLIILRRSWRFIWSKF